MQYIDSIYDLLGLSRREGNTVVWLAFVLPPIAYVAGKTLKLCFKNPSMTIKPVNSISEIRERARPLFQKYSVAKAAIFGSFARDQQTVESDCDLLVEFQEGAGRSFALVHLHDDLEEILGRSVDLLTFDGLEDNDHDEFYDRVKHEFKILYTED